MWMAKKYAKFDVNFFDDERVRLIEALPNGDTYLIIYLKLEMHGQRTKEDIYLDDEEIARITNKDIQIVYRAMEALEKYGLIKSIYEDEVPK